MLLNMHVGMGTGGAHRKGLSKRVQEPRLGSLDLQRSHCGQLLARLHRRPCRAGGVAAVQTGGRQRAAATWSMQHGGARCPSDRLHLATTLDYVSAICMSRARFLAPDIVDRWFDAQGCETAGSCAKRRSRYCNDVLLYTPFSLRNAINRMSARQQSSSSASGAPPGGHARPLGAGHASSLLHQNGQGPKAALVPQLRLAVPLHAGAGG